MSEQVKAKIVNEDPDSVLDLAVERTELAWERTHLAWIRTTIAMITSGFAIDTVAEVFHQNRLAAGKAVIKQAHFLSLGMIIIAILLLAYETFYFVRRSGQLGSMKSKRKKVLPHGVVLSCIIILVGLLLVYYLLFSK